MNKQQFVTALDRKYLADELMCEIDDFTRAHGRDLRATVQLVQRLIVGGCFDGI